MNWQSWPKLVCFNSLVSTIHTYDQLQIKKWKTLRCFYHFQVKGDVLLYHGFIHVQLKFEYFRQIDTSLIGCRSKEVHLSLCGDFDDFDFDDRHNTHSNIDINKYTQKPTIVSLSHIVSKLISTGQNYLYQFL